MMGNGVHLGLAEDWETRVVTSHTGEGWVRTAASQQRADWLVDGGRPSAAVHWSGDGHVVLVAWRGPPPRSASLRSAHAWAAPCRCPGAADPGRTSFPPVFSRQNLDGRRWEVSSRRHRCACDETGFVDVLSLRVAEPTHGARRGLSVCLSPAQAPPSRWGRPLRPSMPTAAGQGCRLKRGRQGQTARRTGRPQRATRRTLRTSSAEAASGRVPTLRGRGADVVVGPGRGHRGAGLAGSDSSARCRCPRAEFQVRRSGVGRAGARGVKDGA